jgi:Holliday junction resolvase-like predicted endonuclease
MNDHILLKFRYFAWNQDDSSTVTIDEHKKIFNERGKVWWGRPTTISRKRAESIKEQIQRGVKTYAFLYSTAVPTSIHQDKILWYRAELLDISMGNPKDRDLIPEYYRDLDLACAFLLGKTEEIYFGEGHTPKVLGQTSIRYVSSDQKTPEPRDLRVTEDPDSFVCPTSQPQIGPPKQVENVDTVSDDLTLKDEVIELQRKVIELQSENSNLREYQERYNRIVGTDYLFSSEKFFENWLQENIHLITPELEILDRQLHAKWPDGKFSRLDLLAVNKETGALTIIEVKTRKRSTRSGYDQFIRYTSWAKRNLHKLVESYNGKRIEKESGIDFVIISDYVNEEMKSICSDHNIRLINVFGGLAFEECS